MTRTAIGVSLAITPALALAQAHVEDTTFLDADWSTSIVLDQTPSQGSTFTAMQEMTGGNPGAHQATSLSFPYVDNGTNQTVQSASIFTAQPIDVVSIGYPRLIFRFDVRLDAQLGGTPGASVAPAVMQDGSVYVGPFSSNLFGTTGMWMTIDGAVDLRDLECGPCSSPVDLSPDASSITPGFAVGLAAGVGPTITIDTFVSVDNFSARFLGGCNPADLAPPFSVLDLADTDAFIAAFLFRDPLADLAPPAGVIDLADIDAFIAAFLGGCP